MWLGRQERTHASLGHGVAHSGALERRGVPCRSSGWRIGGRADCADEPGALGSGERVPRHPGALRPMDQRRAVWPGVAAEPDGRGKGVSPVRDRRSLGVHGLRLVVFEPLELGLGGLPLWRMGAAADLGWVWVPGTVWAPSWCEWRVDDGFTGWAPLPPPGFAFSPGIWSPWWVFVPSGFFLSFHLEPFVVPHHHARHVFAHSKIVHTDKDVEGHKVPTGPSAKQIGRATGERITAARALPPRPGRVEPPRRQPPPPPTDNERPSQREPQPGTAPEMSRKQPAASSPTGPKVTPAQPSAPPAAPKVAPAPPAVPSPAPSAPRMAPAPSPAPSAPRMAPVPSPAPSAPRMAPAPSPAPSAPRMAPAPSPAPSAPRMAPAPSPAPSAPRMAPAPSPAPSAPRMAPAPSPAPSAPRMAPAPSPAPSAPHGGGGHR